MTVGNVVDMALRGSRLQTCIPAGDPAGDTGLCGFDWIFGVLGDFDCEWDFGGEFV